MPTARVNINPDTLAFARERAGYPIGRIAEKMQVKEEQWLQWEKGEKKPTTKQLIDLAKYLDRTPGFFYLKELPEESEPLSEFRTINNQLLPEASPRLIKAIREAKRNREILLEFYENQGKSPAEIPSINPEEQDIRSLAQDIRECWKSIKKIKRSDSMKSLYLAWQDKGKTRRWFPIGRLDADLSEPVFKFGYVKGAERAHEEAGFEPLDAFPDFHERYVSSDLFPLFKNRIMNKGRDEFMEYLKQMDLDRSNADPLSILEVSGGTRRTDNLEVFPKISKNDRGEFRTRFFLRGWRYVNEYSRNKVQNLKPGEELRVSIELNNPATGLAVQLLSEDYCMVGWTPRYLVNDILECISKNPMEIKAKVVKVNPAPTPSQERVLVQIQGKWPEDYEPMSGPDFEELWKKGVKEFLGF